MATRNQQIFALWREMQDIIGEANLWPRRIRRYFWTKNLKHWERCLVSAFVYINGLNPVVFMEWANLFGLCRDRAAVCHFEALFRLYEAGRNYRLYAWNVSTKRYEYLDGQPILLNKR